MFSLGLNEKTREYWYYWIYNKMPHLLGGAYRLSTGQ